MIGIFYLEIMIGNEGENPMKRNKLKKLLIFSIVAVIGIGSILSVSAATLDYTYYAEKNPDVATVFGNLPEGLQAHYDTYGKNEGRMVAYTVANQAIQWH